MCAIENDLQNPQIMHGRALLSVLVILMPFLMLLSSYMHMLGQDFKICRYNFLTHPSYFIINSVIWHFAAM